MTKEAFETINEGLQEALEVARGEAEPYRLHERGSYTMSTPLSIQVHLGNPKIARIPELTIRALPEWEGGGWYMPVAQAEALVSAWNGFLASHAEGAAEYTHYILSQRELIRDLAQALDTHSNALAVLVGGRYDGDHQDHYRMMIQAGRLIEQARKELE